MPIYRIEASETIHYNFYVNTENDDDARSIVFDLANYGFDINDFGETSEGIQIDTIQDIGRGEYLPNYIDVLTHCNHEDAVLSVFKIKKKVIENIYKYCKGLIENSVYPQDRWTIASGEYDLHVWTDQRWFYGDIYQSNTLDRNKYIRIFKAPAIYPSEIPQIKQESREVDLGQGYICWWEGGNDIQYSALLIQDKNGSLDSWAEIDHKGNLFLNFLDYDEIPPAILEYFREVAKLFFGIN